MSDKKVKLSVTATGDVVQHEVFEPKNLDKLPAIQFQPNPNVYMIYPYKTAPEMAGGIIVSQNTETKAIIVAVGKNCTGFERGDVVMIDASQPIYGFWIEGDQYSFIYESTIVGKYTNIKFTDDGIIKS